MFQGQSVLISLRNVPSVTVSQTDGTGRLAIFTVPSCFSSRLPVPSVCGCPVCHRQTGQADRPFSLSRLSRHVLGRPSTGTGNNTEQMIATTVFPNLICLPFGLLLSASSVIDIFDIFHISQSILFVYLYYSGPEITSLVTLQSVCNMITKCF